MNTIALFAFLKKLESIDVKAAVHQTLLYSLKMIVLSVIASVPALFAHKFFVRQFGAMGRLLGNGLPLLLTAAVFGLSGILLLLATRDRVAMQILRRKRDLR